MLEHNPPARHAQGSVEIALRQLIMQVRARIDRYGITDGGLIATCDHADAVLATRRIPLSARQAQDELPNAESYLPQAVRKIERAPAAEPADETREVIAKEIVDICGYDPDDHASVANFGADMPLWKVVARALDKYAAALSHSPREQGCSGVERVARALCSRSGVDPDKPLYSVENQQSYGGEERIQVGLQWNQFEGKARTAILVMREPTAEMIAAFADGDQDPGYAEDWRIMIDAALAE